METLDRPGIKYDGLIYFFFLIIIIICYVLYPLPQMCLGMIGLGAEHQQQIGRKLCKC